MRRKPSFRVLLFAITFGATGLALAQESSVVTPRVDGVLRRMSDLLEESSTFAFKAEEIVDEVLDSGFKAELSNVRTIAVRRPNGVVTNVDGDTAHRSAWFDGKTLTVLDRQHNRYAVLDAKHDIDEMLDYVAETFDIVFPLGDVLYSDVYASLTAGAEYSEYLGIHQVEDVPSHHLAFANEWMEWQVWVAAEGPPLPRKITITYMDEPGEPQYTARFLTWNLSPELSDDLFVFEAPEGAREMEPWSFTPNTASAEEKDQ